jgi:DNA-binding MarR family transcriptional regulator
MTNIFQEHLSGAAAALEQARTITPTERRVLQALRDRGPGLPLEVAMRVLSFPEQIAPVLRSLQERGLARAERFGGSPLGDELWSITPLGLQTLEAAQALAQRSVSPPASQQRLPRRRDRSVRRRPPKRHAMSRRRYSRKLTCFVSSASLRRSGVIHSRLPDITRRPLG